jgi:hypothetical protein
MFISVNYNDQRKTAWDKYFLQYPNGNNIAAMWKMFWSIRVEVSDKQEVQSIILKLFNSFGIDEMTLQATILQLPQLFSHYTTSYSWGLPKKITLIPKEPIKFLDNTDWITDLRTTKIVTKEEYDRLRSSIWFIS